MNASSLFVLLFVMLFFSLPVVMIKTIKKMANLSDDNDKQKQVIQRTVPIKLNQEQEEHIKRLKQKLISVKETQTTAEPSLKEPDHDDSVFVGSLGDIHDEGFDPCHEEQISSMEILCKPDNQQNIEEEIDQYTGFHLTPNDIVNGFIVSEIINNKQIL